MYKFFINKHDLIDESWDELQSESLEEILADESWGERVNESREKIQADESQDERVKNERVDESWEEIQADESQDEEVHHDSCKMQDDLERETETFQVNVQREFQASK